MIETKNLSGREKRHLRIRRKVAGSGQRPRLTIFKSLKHLYVQVVDDSTGSTLASVTTTGKAQRESGKKSFCNVENGRKLGQAIAEKMKTTGIDSVVFDRSGYRYHGIIKAVADAAREGGLKF